MSVDPFVLLALWARILTHVFAGRIVGFDELPGGDNFATSTLEQGMEECGESPGISSLLSLLVLPPYDPCSS